MRIINIITFIFLTGCCINSPYDNKNSGEIVSGYNFGRLDVMNCLPERSPEIIIRDSIELNTFVYAMRNCINNINLHDSDLKIEPIDFDTYSVLGYFLINRSCNGHFYRDVEIDHSDKTVRYIIDMKSCGNCPEEVANLNLVKIPKIDKDYKIEFDVD